MTTLVLSILAALAWAGLAGSEPATARQPGAQEARGWDRLGQLGPKKRIKVYLRNDEVLKGAIQEWQPEAVSLLTAGDKVVRLRAEEVSRVTKKSRSRAAMWGAIIGFGIAAPVGAYAGPYIADWGNPGLGVRLRHAGGWGLFFGGIGAGVGTLTGMERTVYKAAGR